MIEKQRKFKIEIIDIEIYANSENFLHTQESFNVFLPSTMKKVINISKENHFKGHGKKFNIVCTPIRRRYCIQNIIKSRSQEERKKIIFMPCSAVWLDKRAELFCFIDNETSSCLWKQTERFKRKIIAVQIRIHIKTAPL